MTENEFPHDMQMISSSQWLTFFADLSRYQGQLVSLEIDEDLLADDPASGKAPLLGVEYDKHKGVTISTGSGTAAQTYTVWLSIDVAVKWYIERKGPDIDPNLRDQLLPLAARLGHIFVIFMAIGILLSYFGVGLLGITSALGLGGFAISLAAKDTITNVISGIVIMFDSPFKVGDRIDVPATGTWGDVVDIGIRSTRVVTRDNRLVIIPNASVVDGEVINYSQPDPSYRLQVDLGISYNGDIPSITKVLEDTIRSVEGVMEDKPVNVLFTGFGDAGMDIRVRWWVKSPGDKRSVTHRVCSAIQDITVSKGIDMPNKTYSLVNTIKINPEDLDELSQSLNAPVHARSDASTVDGDQDSSSEAAN
jgi:small-conductance mechanosensitive channel